MQKLHPHKIGLALGAFFGLIHLCWALLVSSGKAASALSFIYGMHFLSNPFTMLAFSWKGAVVLVVLTSVIGYIVGAVFSFVWNKVATR